MLWIETPTERGNWLANLYASETAPVLLFNFDAPSWDRAPNRPSSACAPPSASTRRRIFGAGLTGGER